MCEDIPSIPFRFVFLSIFCMAERARFCKSASNELKSTNPPVAKNFNVPFWLVRLRPEAALDLWWGVLRTMDEVSDAVSSLARAAICVETFSLRVHEANDGFSDKLLSGRVTMISFP